MITQVQPLFKIKPGQQKEHGLAILSAYKHEEKNETPLYKMRMMRMLRDGLGFMIVTPGKYIRLHVKVPGEINPILMMSDTPMEQQTNRQFVEAANGKVFIAGLGVGLIIYNLLPKIKSGVITSITVMEKYRDVIDLVSPYVNEWMPKGFKINYVEADVMDYMPPKDEVYDTIYFDIWPRISDLNMPDIRILHNRWKNRKNKKNPKAWMDSWMKSFIQKYYRS